MSDQQDPLIGQVVAGRYRVLKPLGEGGMGQVYVAEHEAIEKRIALKVLRPEYSTKEDIVTRFQQEAISASRIKHPNVLDVFDFGRLDSGAAFLAMELLEGHDLADDLSKRGPVETQRGLRIALQICRALAAAHKAGVVHRDMKPDNVFLQHTADGEEIVKIVDFGIAQLRTTDEAAAVEQPKRRRLTKTGMIFGTPEYMSPEQAGGRKTDQRVDVYAVGVILYEMFTAAVPFTGDSFMAVLSAHLNDPPPPMRQIRPDLAISAQLESVVMRSLAKRPDERFQSMSDLASAILATPEGAVLAATPRDSRMSNFPPQGLSPAQPITVGASTAAQFVRGTTPQDTPVAQARTQPVITQLDAATSASEPAARKSGRGALFGSLAAGLALLGVVGFVLLRNEKPQPPAENSEAPAAAAPAPAAPAPTPAPAAPSEPKIAPAPINTQVTLSVDSVPTGAVLDKDGFQVCGATPCNVTVPQGETLTLVAKKAGLSGSIKVLAQEDQTVSIPLKGAAPRPKAPAGERMCEVDVGGLKILRPCKQ